jgi:hypothetical protein
MRPASEYSLDLDALGGSNDTTETSPLPSPRAAHHARSRSDPRSSRKQRKDVIPSENIEGPSDFTLNMDAWMRGRKERAAAPADDASLSDFTENMEALMGDVGEEGTRESQHHSVVDPPLSQSGVEQDPS